MKELKLKKCRKCGAIVEVLVDCNCDNCGIRCCDEQMKELVPNTEDAVFEKHIPEYRVIEDIIEVKVNHVMEEDHYIEWIALADDKRIGKKFLHPGSEAVVEFPYIKGSSIYSFCNKHGLWKTVVE